MNAVLMRHSIVSDYSATLAAGNTLFAFALRQ